MGAREGNFFRTLIIQRAMPFSSRPGSKGRPDTKIRTATLRLASCDRESLSHTGFGKMGLTEDGMSRSKPA